MCPEAPAAPPQRAEPALADLLGRIAHQAGGPFIHRIVKVLPEESAALPYFLARFQLELFSPALFDLHAIDFPAHVRNSVPKRQAEFFAGRLCAQSMLDTYGYGQQAIAVGQHREPVWPDGFIGSITHNGQYAAAIACPDAALLGIGIDIESVIQDEARQAMTDLVVSAAEAGYLRSMTGGLSFDALLTLVFSAKESFFKAAFAQVKAYFDFDAVEVFHIDAARGLIRFRCRQSLGPALRQDQECEAHFEFLDTTSIFTVVLLKADQAPASPTVMSDSYAGTPAGV